MSIEQDKMMPEARARMEYGGWKEVSRRLKRFHVRCLPIIYHSSAYMFFFAGVVIYISLMELVNEAGIASGVVKFIEINYFILLFYWTLRIMLHKRLK